MVLASRKRNRCNDSLPKGVQAYWARGTRFPRYMNYIIIFHLQNVQNQDTSLLCGLLHMSRGCFVAVAGRENTLAYCGQLPAIGLLHQFEMFFLAMKHIIVHGGFTEKMLLAPFSKKQCYFCIIVYVSLSKRSKQSKQLSFTKHLQ